MQRKRVVVLGGGFGGVYTASNLERLARNRPDIEIVLVNHENYFVFQPLLAEVISGDIGLTDTINPLRRLLPRTRLFIRDVDGVDFANKTVRLRPGFWPHTRLLKYDHLVIAMGNVTDFRGSRGLAEHALRFKTLQDAVVLRNHLIQAVQEASIEEDRDRQQWLLTFVVAGGGFSGVECCAQINDFVRRLVRLESSIDPRLVRVILVHSGPRVLDKEFPESLSQYAQKVLEKRGVEFRFGKRLSAATPNAAVLSDDERIPTKTLVSTVPSSPNPVVESMALPNERGRLLVDVNLRVQGHSDVWSLGDCAVVPLPNGKTAPPTAQHATRQAALLASNILATIDGAPLGTFAFQSLGKMGALGHRSAVAELFGRIRLSGFLGWLMWRSVYWAKLPGLHCKLRLGLSWMIDLVLRSDFCQLRLEAPAAIGQHHYEQGEYVFRAGDVGDALYVILKGSVSVLQEVNGVEQEINQMKTGEYFGEMAVMSRPARTASIRCLESTDLLVIGRNDFRSLMSHLPKFASEFETAGDRQRQELENAGAD